MDTEKLGATLKLDDNKVIGAIDSDKDGKNSLKLVINLPEAYQEAFKRGDVIEGQKYVTMKMEGTKLNLEIDTDRDGEKVASIEADLLESFDEASQLMSDDEETK